MSEQSAIIVGAVAGVFGVIALGMFVRRVGWLTHQADDALLKLSINALFPVFILHVLLGNPALENVGDAWLPPAVGFGCTAMGFAVGAALAWAVGPKIGLNTVGKRRAFAVAVGMFNYGYVPIPLVERLFSPTDGGETLGVLLVHNVGVDVAMWSLGVMIVSGGLSAAGLKKVLNMPLAAIVVALLLNVTGVPGWLNGLDGVGGGAVSASKAFGALVGATAIPFALLLVGATSMDELRKADFKEGWGVVGAGMALRLGVLPVGFLALAWALGPGATGWGSLELRRVIAVEASMPSALFPVLLARLYGADPGTAMRVALSTAAAGLVTIPLWLSFGLKWLGLAA
ncbi:MAG: AEC family transporter [Planctomycetota bacterium]